jgi:polysaccharide biosynthesis protein PelG
MAGIGFTLRKLTQKDDLKGVVHAFGSAMMAAAGPWLFTVIALAGITNIYSNFFAMEGLMNFRVIVIYNFAFSLVLSAPVYMVVTRYLADNIHRKNVTNVPSVVVGSMIILYAVMFPVAFGFYFGFANLPLSLQLSAVLNLFLISSVWLLGVFLSALKDFNAITWAYGIGMIIAVIVAQILKDVYGDAGMLNGFSIGLAFIVFSLAAKIFSEYAYKYNEPFDVTSYFKKYWQLAVSGLFYNAAIWVDKWIMWFAPESFEIGNTNMRMYPDYDSAMFLAYLTIVPAMAVFVFSVETNFFERYQRFYDNILQHKPLRKILDNQKALIDSVLNSSRNFIIVQATIAFLCIALAPQIFDALNINFTQIGIFRMGVLGAFFHVLLLFEMIILSYFDDRRSVMWLCIFFFAANAILTVLTLTMGFSFYGYGYFLSSMATFILASIVLFTYIKKLPYHAFITSNNSVLEK